MKLARLRLRRDPFFLTSSSSLSRVSPSEDDRGQDGDEGQDDVGVEGSGERRQGSWKPSEKKAGAAKAKAKPKASTTAAKLEHRNPMFHAANVNAESAVAR